MYEQLTSIQSALAELRLRAFLPDPPQRRALRRRVGLSQSAIADAIGVTPAMVSRYEAGTSVPRDNVLAKYVQVLALLAVESSVSPEVLDIPEVHQRRSASSAHGARWTVGRAGVWVGATRIGRRPSRETCSGRPSPMP